MIKVNRFDFFTIEKRMRFQYILKAFSLVDADFFKLKKWAGIGCTKRKSILKNLDGQFFILYGSFIEWHQI